MALKSINLYYSYLDAFQMLSDAEVGRLIRGALNYAETGDQPKLSGNEKFIWSVIKGQIDRDQEAYDAKCKKNSENALKRTQATASERKRTLANVAKDKDKDKDKDKEEDKKKPAKHKYGEFQHVLLTDGELEKLKSAYPDYLEKIRNLDEYIENKGAKYKNHYLTICNWARRDAKGSGKRDYGEGGFQEW